MKPCSVLVSALLVLLGVAAADDAAGPLPGVENLALGKTVIFDTPPNYTACVDEGDATQLVDGKLASETPIWYDAAAVAWVLVDPTVFTIDLGQVQPIRGVGLRMGAGQAGVEWPAAVRIYVSDDGERYSAVGDLMQMLLEEPPEQGYAALWLATDKLRTHGRYVRIVCTPVNLGTGQYIMLDEVQVYRGEAEWLQEPLAFAEAPQQWRADLDAINWSANIDITPPTERPRHIQLIDGDVAPPSGTPVQQATPAEGGVCFSLLGEAGRPRSMSWTGVLPKPISTAQCRYALLQFSAEGIRRTYDVRPLVLLQGINDKTSANSVTLLEANQPLNDGRSHTLIKPLPEGFTLQDIKVVLLTQSDAPRLTLQRLELLDAIPDVFTAEVSTSPAQPAKGLMPVSLGEAANGSLSGWCGQVLAKYGAALDGVGTLPPGPVEVSGVPFVIGDGESNIAMMPDSPRVSERVEFLRQEVDSYYIDPQSRDDAVSVEVGTQCREAFLLLALSAPSIQVRGGVPHTALRLDDIECFSVELSYDQGQSEIAFPYSLADRACYIPARELGAYAVAVDPTRTLTRITLHARHFGMNYALAGLTLNTSGEALAPELVAMPEPARTTSHPEPSPQPVMVRREGGQITFANRWYEYAFDVAEGFVLERFVNRTNPEAEVRIGPNSGLRVRVGDTVYTGRCFEARIGRTSETEAEFRLTSTREELPLAITLTITAHESPELTFTARVRNTGEQPLGIELCLPAIADLALGDVEHTRVFFPQYRAVDTGQYIALRAPYGPEFSTQFMDVYNRDAGIGLMVRTDNAEQQMADFTLRKDPSGVSGGVCFPAGYNEIAPGETRAYPPVSLLAHGGDWHDAFTLYRDWLRSWYSPHRAQDKDYFLNAWDLQCYRASEKLSWREARTPGFITPDRTEFLTDEIFAYEHKYLGHVPDLIHFYDWTYSDENDRHERGTFGSPGAYAKVGGIEVFRNGIAEIQEKWDCPVSLYTLNDRFRISVLPDQELARELAAEARSVQMDDDGSAALRGAKPADGLVFPVFGNPRWEDYFINDIVQMQRDTGCRIVYMDVMPRFSHLRGYNGMSPRENDMNVVTRVREALPPDVALWSEYPFTDVASQYADGCIEYYFFTLHETFARRYNASDRADDLFMEMPMSIGRYALPRYRRFGLPVYIQADNKPGQVDAIFVNGEVFHEDTWHLHHSRIRERINRAYVVKHQYTDCFSTEDPVPHVETAASGITANLFPAESRNLWTLYNGRPKTYTGIVLRVPHRDGATYRDAWNDVALTPSIHNGIAEISLTIDPQQPGCVVQEWGQ